MFRRFYVQKVLCSEGSKLRRSFVQKVLCSEGSMFRRFYIQKVLCSEGPMFRNICSEGPIGCLESTGDYLSVLIEHTDVFTTLNQRQWRWFNGEKGCLPSGWVSELKWGLIKFDGLIKLYIWKLKLYFIGGTLFEISYRLSSEIELM